MSDMGQAKIKPVSNWSAIWILPILALMIGAWLGWNAYQQRGINVEVMFQSGEGIEVGKTQVIYKGMSVGKVLDLKLDDKGENQGVIAIIEMHAEVEPYLREGTSFWLVKPTISLAGISGLETLVSGNYISVSPGPENDKESRKFVALNEAPPMPLNTPGLHLTVKADTLGSLSRGSPVFYRQIEVGEVTDYRLDQDQVSVLATLYIRPEYAHLVNNSTRFWNASGVEVQAGLSGFKVRTESLSSIISGGIAFDTRRADAGKQKQPLHADRIFKLYDDYDSAQAGVRVMLSVSNFEGLKADQTQVLYKGMQVGLVRAMTASDDLNKAILTLSLDPLVEEYLVEGTEFWVVKPSISLAGITGLEALVQGNYIAIRPGEKGKPVERNFTARETPPPLDIRSPGLHFVLFTENLGSVDIGSPVLYKQMKVGSIQSVQLARDRKRLMLGVYVEEMYADLINSSSRFWNASGITVKGGLSGVDIHSESLQSLLAGGVAFETPDAKAPPMPKVPYFTLFAERSEALENGPLITLSLPRADGLGLGAPLRLHGVEVGRVEKIELSKDWDGVTVSVRLGAGGDRIARASSQFWMAKPELGLLRTANLETIVTGPYLEVALGQKSSAPQKHFRLSASAPNEIAKQQGLHVTLSSDRISSMKPGNPVSYRGVVVGKVSTVSLGETANRVLIGIVIEPRYAPLVHNSSRFWESSGMRVDFSLFGGAKVATRSLEDIVEGGISFATPDNKEMGNAAFSGYTFPLFEKPENEWLNWAPRIVLPKVPAQP